MLPPHETVILLAEDDPVVRNVIQAMLTKERYAVLTAKDGTEAFEIAEKFTHPIHLLLTDVQMPGMTGWDLAAAVRRQRPEIKILVMSGHTMDTIREGNTPDAFLRKPFVPPTLKNCIEKVLASDGPVDCEQ